SHGRNEEDARLFQDTGKIKTFLTLAEKLSYTKTAKQLYMSQQAVSRSIASLENELGAQLFVRTTRSVELTLVGRQYYNLFNDLNRIYAERVTLINRENAADNPRKKIKLGVQSFMEASPVLEVYEYIKTKRPEIRLEILSLPPSFLLEQFQRNLIDIIILIDRFLPESLNASKRELTSYPLYLMVSDRHPAATDDAHFEDFMSLPFITDILEGEDSLAHKARMEHDIRMWNLSPEDIMWAYDRGSAITYAELGYGIIIDSDRSKLMRRRRLKMYDTYMRESLWLIYREGEISNIALSLLTKRLKVAFRKANEDDKDADRHPPA
ncbi:MAG: LysR family transcriptional regulator, partial [Clostridiales Family XIII bacterium]|nr:LysR family transcriptional regulator [Clostridiales Family XIII bacterium]